MNKIKNWLRSIATTGSTCASGHKSVISLPNGRFRCMDCQAQW